jgi:hypothetical protein
MLKDLMTDKNTKMQLPGILRFLIKLFQIILYIPIQLIFIPFAIIGLIDAIYKEMGNSKKLGVSFTAVQALQYRVYGCSDRSLTGFPVKLANQPLAELSPSFLGQLFCNVHK